MDQKPAFQSQKELPKSRILLIYTYGKQKKKNVSRETTMIHRENIVIHKGDLPILDPNENFVSQGQGVDLLACSEAKEKNDLRPIFPSYRLPAAPIVEPEDETLDELY